MEEYLEIQIETAKVIGLVKDDLTKIMENLQRWADPVDLNSKEAVKANKILVNVVMSIMLYLLNAVTKNYKEQEEAIIQLLIEARKDHYANNQTNEKT